MEIVRDIVRRDIVDMRGNLADFVDNGTIDSADWNSVLGENRKGKEEEKDDGCFHGIIWIPVGIVGLYRM